MHFAPRLAHIALMMITVFSGQAWSQVQSVRPGINEYYQDPDFQAWIERFERSGREVYDKRNEIAATLGLRAGMTVADVGAGTGLFTLLFAPQVGPEGRVFAVDISAGFMRNVARRAREQGYDNVQTIVSSQRDTKLPPGSIDLVFVCDTYHHFEHPEDMLASIRTALKPGGSLVVIDFRKQPGVSSSWVMDHVRANQAQVVDEIQGAGFELITKHDWLRSNYFMHFRRSGDGERRESR